MTTRRDPRPDEEGKVRSAMSGILHASLGNALYWVWFAQLLFKFFVLIDASIRKQTAYAAAGKMTKQGWLIILGVSLAADLLLGGIMSIFTIAGLVAAIVYTVDVRPALQQVAGKGRGRGRDDRHMGPYGPW